jgi:hypothetical protein
LAFWYQAWTIEMISIKAIELPAGQRQGVALAAGERKLQWNSRSRLHSPRFRVAYGT